MCVSVSVCGCACTSRYLHSNAEVHHGHAGVAVPAHVHGGVATVALALQRGARAAELFLRLQFATAVLQKPCMGQDSNRLETQVFIF